MIFGYMNREICQKKKNERHQSTNAKVRERQEKYNSASSKIKSGWNCEEYRSLVPSFRRITTNKCSGIYHKNTQKQLPPPEHDVVIET